MISNEVIHMCSLAVLHVHNLRDYLTLCMLNAPTGGPDIPSHLFAVTGASKCAESLPYGPSSLTESSSPYVSTQLKHMLHTEWQQNLTTSAGSTLSIIWQFADLKTLQDRFQTAVATGEPVTWTISYAGSTYSKSGTWRFSSGAGNMLSRFAGSGSRFSSDDGLWGAGSGVVNGDGSNYPSEFWGHGILQTNDGSCRNVYLGSSSPSNGLTVSRNLMYVLSGES
jgi:hypothetical protein